MELHRVLAHRLDALDLHVLLSGLEHLLAGTVTAHFRGRRIHAQEVLQTGKKDVEIRRIEPVGQYAVQLHFSDGHNTGIYSWDLLYDYGVRQDEMWRSYLKRMDEAGASREPVKSR